MSKRSAVKPKEPKKRPPKMDDPRIRTLLFYAQPEELKRRHKRTARRIENQDGADFMFDLAVAHGYQCVKCGTKRRLGLDHIRPVSKGGKTEFDNLQLMCKPCNEEKGTQIIDYRPKPEKEKKA